MKLEFNRLNDQSPVDYRKLSHKRVFLSHHWGAVPKKSSSLYVLMGDVFPPEDDIFILVEDLFDVVLWRIHQGRQSEDDDGKNQIVARENPTSQREDEDSDISQNSDRHT